MDVGKKMDVGCASSKIGTSRDLIKDVPPNF